MSRIVLCFFSSSLMHVTRLVITLNPIQKVQAQVIRVNCNNYRRGCSGQVDRCTSGVGDQWAQEGGCGWECEEVSE
jgi:hypothetical protein